MRLTGDQLWCSHQDRELAGSRYQPLEGKVSGVVLVSWIGITDLKCFWRNRDESDVAALKQDQLGPALRVLLCAERNQSAGSVAAFYPLWNTELSFSPGTADEEVSVEKYLEWADSLFETPVKREKWQCTAAKLGKDNAGFYRHMDDAIEHIERTHPDSQLLFNMSPGAPPMQLSLLMWHQAHMQDAKIYQCDREGRVSDFQVPFAIEEIRLARDKAERNSLEQPVHGVPQDELPEDAMSFGSWYYSKRSEASLEVVRKARKFAESAGHLLLLGESGTGKELLANAIHDIKVQLRLREKENITAVNISEFPESLAASELFGIVKGAATDVQESDGKFVEADRGTLFLDEIGEIDHSLQVKLLRALDRNHRTNKYHITRVGDREDNAREVDIHLITATNRVDLRDSAHSAESGEFRLDLFYRINHLHLRIPPLRERSEDIPVIAGVILSKLNALHKRKKTLDADAVSFLRNEKLEGNCRELRAMLTMAFYSFDEETLSEEMLKRVQEYL